MKQVLQDLSSGHTTLCDAPAPSAGKQSLIIDSRVSLISAGTERMLVDFGRASMLEKARKQPEKVKMVLDKVRTDGLLTTIEAVQSKLGQPIPLGYSNVGVVSSFGSGVKGFQPGDRVVSNGSHSDVVRVPKNLCAKIPDNVSDDEAAFTVVASIGLQGIRLAEPTLGESFVVTGVGLIGLLTVQLLRAAGCRVLAIDFDQTKLELAKQFGAEICNPGRGEDPVEAGMLFSRGKGVDGVIITASTQSNDVISQSAQMCRKRGRVILIGVIGLDLNRADFYEKEISFQVSCSYGPGRYDPEYEEAGNDYPFAFVRWTQQRNFEAVLDMLSSGQLSVAPLISHRFNFDDAPRAYDKLSEDKSSLGILLGYAVAADRHTKTVNLNPDLSKGDLKEPGKQAIVGFIGAGNYASRVLIPAFEETQAKLHTISSSGGVNGVVVGKKSGFENATTDTESLIQSNEINTVAIVTRHNTHAAFVKECLHSGKNVFVEKPLAINHHELNEVQSAFDKAKENGKSPRLMLGFNRRYAPQIQKMKSLLSTVHEPKVFMMTMNAGAIPADHWTQDPTIGGGRIIGEACHFIDLMRYLTGSKIVSVQARRIGDNDAMAVTEDKATIILGFADGSFGTIHYLANGASSFSKERVEVFCGQKVLQLDNFRKLKGYGWNNFKKMNLFRQDKGQHECVRLFIESIENGLPCPIPDDEVFEVARITIDVAEQLRQQQ